MNSYQSLAEMVDHLAGRGTAAALIVFRDRSMETWSCSALANEISLLATGLVEAGVRRGEPVLLCAPNSPEWVIAYFAIVCSGAFAVPLDDLSNDQDMARVLADSGARRIFTSQSHLPALKTLNEQAAIDIITLDSADDRQNATNWHRLRAERIGPLPNINREDIASLLYTSGTTGTPKAVPLTHGNLLANVEEVAATNIAGPEDRVLLPLPLHHSYPFTVGLLSTLASGGTLVIPAGISGPQITEALEASRSTILIGVPRLYTALLSAIGDRVARLGTMGGASFGLLLKISMLLRRNLGVRIGRFIFQPLRRRIGPSLRVIVCGGARLEPDVAWKLEALGWEVLTGYGLTETSPIVTFNPRGRARLDSAGLPLPGVEIRVEAKPGQPSGEILVRGPNVFSGYRNNPEATSIAFTPDGWFRTGDLGLIDNDGYLHIVGRVKEIIVLPDGKNVIPEDVEDFCASSPLIREAAILERHGVLAGLFVPDDDAIRAQGAARAQSLLREEIEDISLRLPPYQRVTAFRVTREPLPRTHLGKLQRHRLSDAFDRAERDTAPPVAQELSEEDRRLLASDPSDRVWEWLLNRFSGKAITLDTSPQFDLQIDSLEWMNLSLDIQVRFGVSLTGDALARIITLRDLLNEVMVATEEKPSRNLIAEEQTLTSEETRFLRPMGPLPFLLGLLVVTLNRFVMRTVFRLRVEGAERLPRDGPYIVAPNHVSFLDPPAVSAAFPRGRLQKAYWAGWTGELFAGPWSRLLSRITRVFPVDPDRGPAGGLALGKAVLERRRILVWFPEGRISRTGALGPFLPGVGMLLQQSGAMVIPTLISGTSKALPRGRMIPRRHRVTVVFGHPMNVAELERVGQGENTNERIADGLRQAVAALGDNGQQPRNIS